MSNSKNNFESSLKKLEKIVAKLEEGNIDLDDSIKSFEEGVMLVKECQKQLSEAELKVSQSSYFESPYHDSYKTQLDFYAYLLINHRKLFFHHTILPISI